MPNANTITHAMIEAIIDNSKFSTTKMGEKTTVVCAKLPNGFEIVETSGCVDVSNYNHNMGIAVCKRRIVDKIWLLEGYRLQCEMARG